MLPGGKRSSTACSAPTAIAGRSGTRTALALAFFAVGNLLCGAAADLPSMLVADVIDGIGEGLTIAVALVTLDEHSDDKRMVAIGFYGVVTYATRPFTPFVTSPWPEISDTAA